MNMNDLLTEVRPQGIRFATSILKDSDIAEDAVQQAMIKAWVNRDIYDPSRPFIAWFITILRNTCKDEIRKQNVLSRHFNEEECIDSFGNDRYSPENESLQRERYSALYEAIELLPMRQKQVALLNLQGYKSVEIASETGLSYNTIGVHLFRAKQSLKKIMRNV